MLFALRQPGVLAGLLLGFVVGCVLRVALQRVLVAGSSSLRGLTRPATWLDPFGAVAAALTGVGWAPRPPPSRGRPTLDIRPLLGAVVAHGLLAAAGFAAFVAVGGPSYLLTVDPTVAILHGQGIGDGLAQQVTLGFAGENLACGLLTFVPIPPLELGVVLWSRLPRTPGARRIAYHVLEEQWGVAALLVLLLLPLAGEQPLLLALLADAGNAILRTVF